MKNPATQTKTTTRTLFGLKAEKLGIVTGGGGISVGTPAPPPPPVYKP
jgi:hypothetical protein